MPSLLFVHGAPGDARMWAPVIGHLSPELDTHALTLSFFGSRAAPAGGECFGTERHARDILEFIDSSFDLPVNVVAWSFGVHPVLLAALQRPHLFKRLFLYEPGLPTYVDNPAELAEFEADAGAAFGPIAIALQSAGPEAAVAALIDCSGGEGYFERLSADRREIYLDSCGMMPLLMGGGQPPANITVSQLATLQMPVTVAMGSATRPVFAVPSRALAQALPRCDLVTVDGAGHMLPETDPAQFATLVDRWLAKETA